MLTNQVKSLIVNLLFLLLGCWTIYLLHDKIDMTAFDLKILKNKSLTVVLLATFCAYWFRVKRWQLLLSSNNTPQKGWQIASSMFYGYFINLALPRVGE